MATIYRLHATLLAGKPGEIVLGVMATLVLVSVVSGVVLWWSLIHAGLRAAFAIRRQKVQFRSAQDCRNRRHPHPVPDRLDRHASHAPGRRPPGRDDGLPGNEAPTEGEVEVSGRQRTPAHGRSGRGRRAGENAGMPTRCRSNSPSAPTTHSGSSSGRSAKSATSRGVGAGLGRPLRRRGPGDARLGAVHPRRHLFPDPARPPQRRRLRHGGPLAVLPRA